MNFTTVTKPDVLLHPTQGSFAVPRMISIDLPPPVYYPFPRACTCGCGLCHENIVGSEATTTLPAQHQQHTAVEHIPRVGGAKRVGVFCGRSPASTPLSPLSFQKCLRLADSVALIFWEHVSLLDIKLTSRTRLLLWHDRPSPHDNSLLPQRQRHDEPPIVVRVFPDEVYPPRSLHYSTARAGPKTGLEQRRGHARKIPA